MTQDKGRTIDRRHHVSHRKGFARTRYAEQRLSRHPFVDTLYELANGFRLVARGLESRSEFVVNYLSFLSVVEPVCFPRTKIIMEITV